MNYYPTLLTLGAPEKHPMADRLQLFTIADTQVITDLSYREGDSCFFFPVECVIHPTILKHLNLYSDADLNAVKTKKGYIDKNGRVRATKLRGVFSGGLLLHLHSVQDALNTHEVPPFGEVEKFAGVELSTKYEPPVYLPKQQRDTPKAKPVENSIVPGYFSLQPDTPNVIKSPFIKPGSTYIVTEKLHGSNAAIGCPIVRKKLKWYEKVLAFLKIGKFFGVQEQERKIVHASRHIIKTFAKGAGFYGQDIWAEALKYWIYPGAEKTWPENLVLYGEIVGKTSSGRWIQKGYDYDALMDPGETIKFIAFRGVYMAPGKEVELSWEELVDVCTDLGIKVVPRVGTLYIDNGYGLTFKSDSGERGYYKNLAAFKARLEGNCTYCRARVPREGVVLTLCGSATPGQKNTKLKTDGFLERETRNLDNGISSDS